MSVGYLPLADWIILAALAVVIVLTRLVGPASPHDPS